MVEVEWSNKVLVEPLSLFNLKADVVNRLQLLPWEIDDEPDAKVI